MTKYLTQDYTGALSKIQYGKKGDTVTVISERDNMALVDSGKELFHIRREKLSDDPVEKEAILATPDPLPAKKKTRVVKHKKLF